MTQGATPQAIASTTWRRPDAEEAHQILSPSELARRYGDGIRKVALRVTRSEPAAQDVMQEVFVRVLASGGFDASRGSLEGWLHAVTHRAAVDWIRREAAHQRRLIRVGAIHCATTVAVEEAASARGEAARVRAAVAQLPEGERVAVSLAYFGGLSYREVAHQLGLAEGTVKTRIRRALTRLAHLIGTDCTGPSPAGRRPDRSSG
jgi:RNA polymerase sigma factor (sigma-70 family)